MTDTPKPKLGPHERAAIIADKIVAKLSEHGFVAPATLIADVLQPIMFPPYCKGCSLRMCPQCDGHCMPGFIDSPSEYETYDLCFKCKSYVAPDGNVLPVCEDDIRWKEMQQFQAALLEKMIVAHGELDEREVAQVEQKEAATDKVQPRKEYLN